MREIVLDTETTGLNYKDGDRVIEVGCVETKNYVATGKTLSFYCRVDKEISEEAKKISGISNEFFFKISSRISCFNFSSLSFFC